MLPFISTVYARQSLVWTERGLFGPWARQGASPMKLGLLRLMIIVTLNTAPLGSRFCWLTLLFWTRARSFLDCFLRINSHTPKESSDELLTLENPSSPTLCFPLEHCLLSCHRLLLWHLHNRPDRVEMNMLIKNRKCSSPWEKGKLNFKSLVEVWWNICISSL